MQQENFLQLVAYLVVPVVLGYEFFMCARDERRGKEDAPVGSLVLDFFGVLFMGLVPAIFLFTLWALQSPFFSLREDTIHRLQRYGVFFMFLGAWWQVYIYGALKVRRVRKSGRPGRVLWQSFLLMGVYASILVAWNFPWHLNIVSAVWFLFLAGLLSLLKVKPTNMERIFWILAVLTFVGENLVFVWFNAIV